MEDGVRAEREMLNSATSMQWMRLKVEKNLECQRERDLECLSTAMEESGGSVGKVYEVERR